MSVILFTLFSSSTVLAASYPDGEIIFYNASDDLITAQVSSSSFGKFTLSANEQKNVAYSSLMQVCSSNPTNCKAHFYVNNVPAGSATINALTGKLVKMNLSMNIATAKNAQQVLRRVVIK